MLAEVVEKVEETRGTQAAPSELTSPAGSELVTCDLCTGTRKQSALMSCVVCLVSYCETHLQPHHQVPGLKRHKLVKATSGLQERICSRHDKLLEVFCRTDQRCICYLCVMDEHKGHDTVSAAAERAEKLRTLGLSRQKVQTRVQEREKQLKTLQQAVELLKRSGQAAEQDSERIFTELIRSIERRRSEVKELIRAQQGAAEGLVERLEQEIAELRRRDAELEQLSRADDDDEIRFLQSYRSLSSPSETSDPPLPPLSVPPPQYFTDVSRAVSELRDKLEDVIKGAWANIAFTVSTVDVYLPTPPKTRADFFKYSCPLTLDPNTTHKLLSLSDDSRTATRLDKSRPYPDHPQRFDWYAQVLCREALSGRCYWEVELRSEAVDIAVSYPYISRKGTHSLFGMNAGSWKLRWSGDGYTFSHNKAVMVVPGAWSGRVGVYLDHKAGFLSFYSVSDRLTCLLHRVQTTFTQPVYPGFGLYHGANDSVQITKLWFP